MEGFIPDRKGAWRWWKGLRAVARVAAVPAFCGMLSLGMPTAAAAQCAPGVFGVYFDPEGTQDATTCVLGEELALYVILFAENPVGGAAWRVQLSSEHYDGSWVGPPGPDCQPPDCEYQDPPFWLLGVDYGQAVALGEPFAAGVLQAFNECQSGFFGNPILLAEIRLMPWAQMLVATPVDLDVIGPEGEILSYTDCQGLSCTDVVDMTTYLVPEAIQGRSSSLGGLKLLYR